MNTDVIDVIQAVIRDQLRAFRTAELGVVTTVYSHAAASDSNNYECDVRLRDTGLELKRLAVCTQRIGSVAIPNVGDLVLVQYLNGDMHAAVITGRFHNDKDRSPEAKDREWVYVSPDKPETGVRRLYLAFPNGNTLLLDDDKLKLEMGKTTLTIDHDGSVVLQSNNQPITLKDQNGSNSIEISPGGGQIKVQAQAKVVVDAPAIELVGNATHPVVYGDQLIQYLNQLGQIYQSHMHPGEMALGAFPVTPAPPVPPFPPATPALLSTIVKTG